jgi:hypothetical protein
MELLFGKYSISDLQNVVQVNNIYNVNTKCSLGHIQTAYQSIFYHLRNANKFTNACQMIFKVKSLISWGGQDHEL